MITVYYKNANEEGCVIRPTPLVSIASTPIRNGMASYGSEYTITLTGTLIATEGSPIWTDNGDAEFGPSDKFNQIGPNWDDSSQSDQRPNTENVPYQERLNSIFTKQAAIRELFARDGQKMEISPISNDGAVIVCYPQVESINFEEGIYVDICRFTVTLTATSLLDANGKVFEDGMQRNVHDVPSGDGSPSIATEYMYKGNRLTEKEILDRDGGFVSDVSDSWSLEPDESLGNTTQGGRVIPVGYRLTRNVTATGQTKYIGDFGEAGDAGVAKRYEAWENARNYIKKTVIEEDSNGVAGSNNYPYYDVLKVYGSGFLELSGFGGYSHSRTENIDQAAGTYSLTDSWVLASGVSAFETFTMSIGSSTDAAYVEVGVNGTIRGANNLPASGQVIPEAVGEGAYDRALNRYYEVSNNGQYGVGCDIYKRANAAVDPVLNMQPKSISLSTNEYAGEITYNITFDNRPQNIFSDVMSESISVNDTYPGDVFASIPVLGRANGPVLQYLSTRTEYTRSLSLDIQLDYTDIGYGNNRANLMMTKPSVNEPLRSEINDVIAQVSPANEPGIVKYFIGPPSESWNPRTGSYSLQLQWTYEVDR